MLRSEENKIKNHLEGGAGKVLTEFGWGKRYTLLVWAGGNLT